MAFQNDPAFSGFLRATARGGVPDNAAPAVNFLLEERLNAQREADFLGARKPPTAVGWTAAEWWETYANHYHGKIACPRARLTEVATFSADNHDNHLNIESDQDVVRLESISSLFELWQGEFDTAEELADALRALLAARNGKPQPSDLLPEWLDGLNRKRDWRPAFVTPYGEVEDLLKAPDWANRLRDALGLAHLKGTVVLCRYNLSAVEKEAGKAKVPAWAATPTILEAGGKQGPSTAFFPYPRKASAGTPFGHGVTVDLSDADELAFTSEFLHFRHEYKLDDFVRIGQLNGQISDAALAAARQRHFALFEADFAFRADVP